MSVYIQEKLKSLSQDTKEMSEKLQLISSAFFAISMVRVAFASYCLGYAMAAEQVLQLMRSSLKRGGWKD